MSSSPRSDSRLPFRFWWPIGAGALVGVALRIVFSGDGRYAAMSAPFILLVPLVVGAVTVLLAERVQRRTWAYYVTAPIVANALFVAGTMAILIEGLVCALLIVPLFCALGVVGGLLMGAICRFARPRNGTFGFLLALPLALGGFPPRPPPDDLLSVERSVLIAAPVETVWAELENASDIRPEEVSSAWLFRIGVPLPREGRMQDGARTRRVRMDKDVYFDEVIVEARPNELIRWTYRFYEDSFPPYALDEHVVIGGRHFDVRDTSYSLTPRAAGTELRVRIGFRVSTSFNWYARPLARFLIGNLAESNLRYYRGRSESVE